VRFTYPLLLDLRDRLVVIVGGGAVAVRKAAGLLDAGATRVRVVAPTFHANVPAAVEQVAEAYAAHHLDGATLVFAATDSPAVNEQVVRDANARGVLVNRADEGDPGGDFTTPAKFQDGGVIVTVSAGSAALSAAIRDDLAARLDPRQAKMATAMQLLRPMIQAAGLDPDQRRAIFRDLAGAEALDQLKSAGIDQLRRWIAARYPDVKL
jgi:siroheme synthase-like protein